MLETIRKLLTQSPSEQETSSICAFCLEENDPTRVSPVVPAKIERNDNGVWLRKECPVHGVVRERTWRDVELADRLTATEGAAPQGNRISRDCPQGCGFCKEHLSNPAVVLVEVTHRCNLQCKTCFANGGNNASSDPEIEGIIHNLQGARRSAPNTPPKILQLIGGEPTLRDDLPQIIRAARTMGYEWIHVDTNGRRIAEDLSYTRALREAGADTLYLQFDTLDEDVSRAFRGVPGLVETRLRALENAKQAGFKYVILVPVIERGTTSQGIGELVRFALERPDIIGGINFQPKSYCGRTGSYRSEYRYTLEDLIEDLASQTDGLVQPQDWYPWGYFTELLDSLSLRHLFDCCPHPHCGAVTLLALRRKKDPLSLSKILDVEPWMRQAVRLGRHARREYQFRLNRTGAFANQIAEGLSFIYGSRIAFEFVRRCSVKGLREMLPRLMRARKQTEISEVRDYYRVLFEQRFLLLSVMAFMDAHNFDTNRSRRCVVQYATDKGLIPFCAMNVLHRGRQT